MALVAVPGTVNNTRKIIMPSKVYTYQGTARFRLWVLRIAGTLSILIGTLFTVFVIWAGLRGSTITDAVVCMVFWFLVVGWAIGLLLYSAYPELEGDDKGLWLSFLQHRIFVPWSEVIGIRRLPWQDGVLVLAQRITHFHRLYGWLYARSVMPAFLISRSISGWDELLSQLQKQSSAPK
jgi:hypothetical protein